jgi:hypothetical protein
MFTSSGLQTPAFAYEVKVKTILHPSTIGGTYRVRFDHVDTFGKVSLCWSGKMHHLGVGRAHAAAKRERTVEQRTVKEIRGSKISLILTVLKNLITNRAHSNICTDRANRGCRGNHSLHSFSLELGDELTLIRHEKDSS